MSSLDTNNLLLHNHDPPIMDYVQQEYDYDFQNYPSYFSPNYKAVEFDNSSLNFERVLTKFDAGRVCSLVEAPAKTIDVIADFGAKGDGRTDDTQKAWDKVCSSPGNIKFLVRSRKNAYILKPLRFFGPCKTQKIQVET
ncbi:Polygalacturonase [Orobanche hederae]